MDHKKILNTCDINNMSVSYTHLRRSIWKPGHSLYGKKADKSDNPVQNVADRFFVRLLEKCLLYTSCYLDIHQKNNF